MNSVMIYTIFREYYMKHLKTNILLCLIPSLLFLFSCATLQEETRRGNIDGVRGLLDKGADPDAYDMNGITPLGFAVFRGEVEIVNFLLEKGRIQICKIPMGILLFFYHVQVPTPHYHH